MRRRQVPVVKQQFLAAFAQLGNVAQAAREAGCHRTSVYLWLKADEDSGLVVLGMACAVQTPVFLPATGDGSMAPFVEDYSDTVPFDWWGYAEY